MTDRKLQEMVAEAVEVDRQVAELTERLKRLKGDLVAEAQSRPEEHRSIEGSAGTKWTWSGSDGCICRVTFPAPKLRATVDPDSKPGRKIVDLAGTSKGVLFQSRVVYVPVPEFRDKAVEILGGKAVRLIAACETESAPRVEFETKQEQH